MLTRRVIPCLDTRDGRVVKGVKFQNLRDSGSPAELAAAYEAAGADEIVILDVSATLEGRANALETVRAVRGVVGVPLTVGGGVRTADDARALLEAGADKVSVNTAAVQDPSLLTALATRYGAQCVTLAVDARRDGARWTISVRSGTAAVPLDAVEWAQAGAAAGAGEILLTSMDRDGTQSGYDTELIAAVSSRVNVPVVASGGARTSADMVAALRAGADAVLAASIFHDGLTTVTAIKAELRQAGIEVRP
jgi:cyclase